MKKILGFLVGVMVTATATAAVFYGSDYVSFDKSDGVIATFQQQKEYQYLWFKYPAKNTAVLIFNGDYYDGYSSWKDGTYSQVTPVAYFDADKFYVSSFSQDNPTGLFLSVGKLFGRPDKAKVRLYFDTPQDLWFFRDQWALANDDFSLINFMDTDRYVIETYKR